MHPSSVCPCLLCTGHWSSCYGWRAGLAYEVPTFTELAWQQDKRKPSGSKDRSYAVTGTGLGRQGRLLQSETWAADGLAWCEALENRQQRAGQEELQPQGTELRRRSAAQTFGAKQRYHHLPGHRAAPGPEQEPRAPSTHRHSDVSLGKNRAYFLFPSLD